MLASSMTKFQSIAKMMITYMKITGMLPRLKPSQRPFTPICSSKASQVAMGRDTRYKHRMSTDEAILYLWTAFRVPCRQSTCEMSQICGIRDSSTTANVAAVSGLSLE